MESFFPCDAGRPRFPVRCGGRSYMTESDLAFPIISRFSYSSTMETGFFFTYQLSQSIMTFFFSLNAGIACRTMDAASSSLDSVFSHMRYPGGMERQRILLLFHTGTQSITLTKQCPFKQFAPLCEAWSNSFETFSNFVPDFATIVSSIHRKTGWDCSPSGTGFSAMPAVTFINLE